MSHHSPLVAHTDAQMLDSLAALCIVLVVICVYIFFKARSHGALLDADAVNLSSMGTAATESPRVKTVHPSSATQRGFCSNMCMLLSNIATAGKSVCADIRFSSFFTLFA